MNGEFSYLRMADKLTAYIEKYVTVAGAEKQEEVLDLFDKMHLLFPHWVIMTCPIMHPDIKYVSKNYLHVFGENSSYITNSTMEKYYEQVHEADQECLRYCFDFVFKSFEEVMPELHCLYRNIFHYRIKKKDGQHVYLHDEKAVLNMKDSGNLYYTLFRDITAEKAFAGVKVEVYKQGEVLSKIKEYKPSAEHNPLSKREGELVTLIKQGLSTKEIAWYLKISHHTVRNIKSKLFEKFKVSNSIELLNMTA